jgi:hypothetical protein
MAVPGVLLVSPLVIGGGFLALAAPIMYFGAKGANDGYQRAIQNNVDPSNAALSAAYAGFKGVLKGAAIGGAIIGLTFGAAIALSVGSAGMLPLAFMGVCR